MTQKILLIGNGRLAGHLRQYFRNLGLTYATWHRGQSAESLDSKIAEASHCWLAISDRAIDPFIESNQLDRRAILIHSSGVLVSKYAWTAHPVQTFGSLLYSEGVYRRIPFVLELEGPCFNELLPFLPNHHITIPRRQKARYHALCVMANNFTSILWKKFFDEMAELGMESTQASSLLDGTIHNIQSDYRSALTGPLARGDRETVRLNTEALQGDPFQRVYQAFVNAYSEQENIA